MLSRACYQGARDEEHFVKQKMFHKKVQNLHVKKTTFFHNPYISRVYESGEKILEKKRRKKCKLKIRILNWVAFLYKHTNQFH